MAISLIAFLFLAANSQKAASAGYDIYVDKGYGNDDSDGSVEKPYQTISKAIENSSKGDAVYVKNGTYNEDVALEKGMEITGQNKDKTIIKGTINSKGNNKIEKITIIGKSYGISAEGKIEVDDCKIKDSSKIGIDLKESDQDAKITNSVISGNEKGVYVQRARSIFISKNSIYGNKGEGLDIREKMNGIVSGNEIFNNGEGGIEVIVGGSDLKIMNNSIKKNTASGIASQFYSFIEKTGNIAIKNNIISKNGKYGFMCGIPSGGSPSGSYWNDSVALTENTIEDNKMGAIDNTCNIIEVVDKEEEKTNSVKETKNLDEDQENAEIKENIIKEQVIEQENKNNDLIKLSEEEITRIGEINKVKIFFFGMREKDLAKLKENKTSLENGISNLKNMEGETKNEDTLKSIEDMVRTFESEKEKISNFISSKENSFSLFGWFFRLFEKNNS